MKILYATEAIHFNVFMSFLVVTIQMINRVMIQETIDIRKQIVLDSRGQSTDRHSSCDKMEIKHDEDTD